MRLLPTGCSHFSSDCTLVTHDTEEVEQRRQRRDPLNTMLMHKSFEDNYAKLEQTVMPDYKARLCFMVASPARPRCLAFFSHLALLARRHLQPWPAPELRVFRVVEEEIVKRAHVQGLPRLPLPTLSSAAAKPAGLHNGAPSPCCALLQVKVLNPRLL